MSDRKAALQEVISGLEAMATDLENEIEGTTDDDSAERLEHIRDSIDLAIRNLEDALGG